MFRPFVILLTALCVAYFVIGGILLAIVDSWTWQKFLEIGGVVGGIASVIGLTSLIRSGLSNSDLRQYEIEVMRRFTSATEEFQKVDRNRTETQKQLDELKQQHERMKALMQKAALTVYLQERHQHCEDGIRRAIADSPELSRLVEELPQIQARLAALDEEIKASPDVELIEKLINGAERISFGQRFMHYLKTTNITISRGRL